ncbi:glycoside hydrolase family 35 protein [Spirillospora sp. CA-294931]|uniref:glycoside hydrolase family 35 protein n=1 Tax=Spirillospora sp. CA-294931 TaxID=3240042 RepID=UPI003D89B222
MLTSKNPAFTVEGADFVLDGRPFRLLAGAVHYFRVHPGHWDHRLAMARAMGLNTIETYVPWNLHEPEPGRYARLGELERFLDATARAGLYAVVRPGPYICAEWDNGGLPSWLTGELGRRTRTRDPAFLAHLDRWFDRVIPLVAERQIHRGGNVLMVQAENEYGSYGSDAVYLAHVADGLRARGVEVPLFTSDGPEEHMLTGGMIPGVLATVNFGSDAESAFAMLKRYRPEDPLVCMEFWNGWFDHWGEEHVTRDPTDAAEALEQILDAGGSVNVYMAHGGTNFGTWAGANRGGAHHDGAFQPTVTSYDYDAPISEQGAPTEKFWLYRDVLTRYGGPAPEPPPAPPVLPPRPVPLTASAPLEAALGNPVTAPVPPTFDELGLRQGLVLYELDVPGPRADYPLILSDLRDRAYVSVDGRRVAVVERGEPGDVKVPGPSRVAVLVESLGRVNYGPLMGERKGVLGGIRHERQYLHGVTARPLSLDERPDVPFEEGAAAAVPAFYRGTFTVGEPGDAFVALPGWRHGLVWVNGFALGRYWDRGPQRTLYLPGPVLCEGDNEIVVLELEEAGEPRVELLAEPDLSGGARPS